MYISAKARASKNGYPFDIAETDLVLPEKCPVLGIPFGTCQWYDSPSLDKVIPSLGYVKGNVKIISARANVLKRDGSLEELQAVVKYLKGHNGNK